MTLMKCEECGLEKNRLEIVSTVDGVKKKVCSECYNIMQGNHILTIEFPEDVVFTTFIAKMGKNRRIIEVPKSAKPLLDEDARYYVLLRKIKSWGQIG